MNKGSFHYWVTGLLYLLALAVIGVMIAIAYRQGKEQAGLDWREATAGRQQLEQDLEAAQQEVSRLKTALQFEQARAEREIQINRQAFEEVSQTLLETSKEIASLKEDLHFYESVIQAEGQGRGLQVRALRISAKERPGHYRYNLIVINVAYGKKKQRGTVKITVHGMENGEEKSIPVANDKGKTTLGLNFKYFQRLDGAIVLPEHFQPRRIQVIVKMRGSKASRIEKWYDWPLLMVGEEQQVRPIRDHEQSGVE